MRRGGAVRSISIIASVLILLTASQRVHADAGVFGGQGASVFPVKNNTVTMDSERVIITADDSTLSEDGYPSGWHYDCTFKLRNTEDKKVTIQVGFPEYYTDEDIDEPPVPTIENLKVETEGSAIKFKKKKGIKNPKMADIYYDVVYVWKMTFKPNETLTLHVTYDTGISIGPAAEVIVHYVLSTGALWKDAIGVVDIEIHFNDAVYFPFFGTGEDLDKEEQLALHIKEFEEDYAMPWGKLEIDDMGKRTLKWHLENFEPEKGFSVYYISGSEMRGYDKHALYDELMKTKTEEDARYVLNKLLAGYGKPINDPELRKELDATGWYLVDPKYSEEEVMELEKDFIEKYKKHLSSLKGSPAGPELEKAAPKSVEKKGGVEKAQIHKTGGCACAMIY